VSEITDRGRLAAENTLLRLALAREGRLTFLTIAACLLIGGGIGTFFFFRNLAYADLVAARQRVQQLQNEGETLKKQVDSQAIKINALEMELKQTKDDLEEIRPSKDRYAIPPNESRIVAGGRLTIGLIGAPANESITLSINGKEQTATAGQVINVAADASTNCQVTIQSFDMFRALIVATCGGAKAQ
jgi:hypothetical protein